MEFKRTIGEKTEDQEKQLKHKGKWLKCFLTLKSFFNVSVSNSALYFLNKF